MRKKIEEPVNYGYRVTYEYLSGFSGKRGQTHVVFYCPSERDARIKFLNWCVGSYTDRRILNIEKI